MEVRIEGFLVSQLWDNGDSSHIEIKLIKDEERGSLVQVGSSLTQIPEDSWPAIREKINQLFKLD